MACALPRKAAPFRAPGKAKGRQSPLPSTPRSVLKRAPTARKPR
jgi:hypothetical protein